MVKRFSFLLFLTLAFGFFHWHNLEFLSLNRSIVKKEIYESSKEGKDFCVFCLNFFGNEVEEFKINHFFYYEKNQTLFQIFYKDLRNFSLFKRGPPIFN